MYAHKAKGVLQTNPPTSPNMTSVAATLTSGSDPPKSGPRMGIPRVKYATISKITIFELVALATRTATIAGVIEATPNSSKVNSPSIDKIRVAKKNNKAVLDPAILPTSQILIALMRFRLQNVTIIASVRVKRMTDFRT